MPVLSLWNNVTMEPVSSISGFITNGISMIRFSNDGNLMAVCSLDTYKTIHIVSTSEAVAGMTESSHLLH